MQTANTKKTRVLLINPPIELHEIYAHYDKSGPILAPLGLCYLASVLEKNNYPVKIIDGIAEKINEAELLRQIGIYRPRVVGITLPTVSFYKAAQLARSIKLNFKDILIVVGGPHASAIPSKTLLDCDSFDIAVFGEGEHTFLEIIDNYEAGSLHYNINRIKGVSYRDNGQVFMNPPRPLIENLDTLPYPARHLLKDINLYNTNFSIGEKKPLVHMIPSRGCPFECIFCSQSVFGRKWRCFSAEYIVNEIEFLIKQNSINTVQFQDDLFALYPERVINFCHLLKAKKIKVSWNLSSRVDIIDENLFGIMHDAGCNIVYFGIESGDDDILKILKKGHSIHQVKSAVKAAKRAGLKVHGSFMLGNPGETKQTIKNTIKFALSLPLDAASFFITAPYPDTELTTIASQYGMINYGHWSQYRGHPEKAVFIPFGIKGDYLLEKQRYAYRKFFFRARIIFDRLKRISDAVVLKMYVKGLWCLLKNK